MANISDVQLRIAAIVDGVVEVRKLVNELDDLGGQTTESSAEVEKLVSTLDNLRQQDQLITEFQTLKKGTADLSSTLDEARTRATSLGKGLADSKQQVASTNAEYRSSKAATKALADEWQAAKVKVDLLAKGIKDSTSPTREQRDELKAAKEQAKLLGEQYRASSKETTVLERALRSTEQAVKLQTREFTAARKEVNLLDEQYIKQSGTLNGLRTQLQQSGLNTKQLAAEQRSLKAAASQVDEQVSQLANSLRDQAGNQQWLNQQLQTGENELKQFDSAARQAKGSTKALGDEAGASANRFSTWAKGVMASAAALLSLDRAKDAIVDLVTTSADMDIMEKNAKRAGLAFEDLNQVAADTPLQLTEVMDAAIKTKNYGLDPMSGALQAAIDAAAASGKGYEQVDGILTALGQAYTKTKLQQEEMNQLAERGIPAWSLLAEATGKSIPELQDMATAGKLGRDEINLLIQAIGKEYVGAAKSAMNSTRGLASNLGDEFTKAKDAVADSGLTNYVNEQLRDAIAYIKQLRDEGTLKEWGKELSEVMRAVGDYTRTAVAVIKTVAPELKTMALAWAGLKAAKWLSDLRLLGAGFKTLSTESSGAAASITKAQLAAQMADQSIGGMNKTINASTGLVGALKSGFVGLLAGLMIEEILKAADAFRQMKDAQEAATKAQQLAITTGNQLKDRYADISKQVGITITNMDQFDKLIEEGKIHLDQASGLYKRGAEGIKEIGNAASKTNSFVSKFYEHIDELRKKLSELKPGSDDAAKVVTDMFNEMEVSSRKSVSFIITQLTEMQQKGEVTGKTIDQGLGAAIRNLSSKDLIQLQNSLDQVGQRMDAVGEKARQTGEKLNTELFKRVGLDLQEMRTGFTEAGKATIDVFGEIATNGKNSSAEIRAAFLKAIDTAATKQEADQLTSIFRAAGKSGAVSLQDIETALGQSAGKTKELTTATGVLGDAYSDLGIKSAEALDRLAQKQKSAFEEIQRSGASMYVQRQAFLAYAEAELKAAQANDRYADGALSAQAAGLGLSEQFKALEQTTANVGNQALITAGALDTLAASEKNTGDATDKASEKTKEMASAWEGAAAASQFLTDYTSNLTTSLQKLSPAAAQMMNQMMGWTNATTSAGAAIDEINQKLAQNAREMKESMDSIATNDIQEYIDKMNKAYLAAERAYLEQAKAAEQMIDSLSSSKNLTDQMVSSAESAYGSLDMLDSQTLSRLRAAIDSAKQKMESLESAAKSTLNSLQDELDQYNNNLDAIEQRRYENQIEDLQAKLKEAQAAGNSDAAAQYKEALQLAEELHQKKMADIEAEKNAAATTSASTTTNVNTSTTTTSTSTIPTPSQSQPTEVIELRIGGARATVSADPNNAASLKDMLRTLQQHAMRS